MSAERRRHPRVPADLPCTVVTHGEAVQTRLVELSGGGAQLDGTGLADDLAVVIGPAALSLSAHKVRETEDRTAVQFDALSENDRQGLLRLAPAPGRPAA